MDKTNMKKSHTTTIIIILQILVCSIMLFGHAQQSFGQTSPIDDPDFNPLDYLYDPLNGPAVYTNSAVQNNKLTGKILTANVSTVTTQNKPIVFTPQVGLPGFMSRYAFTSNSTSPIAKLMAELFKYGVQIIVILALIVIIVGGFLWSTAGGNGQKVTEAKQWIFSGLGGLSLALFAYLILRTINIGLVNFKPTSIQTVTGLTLNTKSNPDQVADDRGFLNGIYTKTFGDLKNLDSEACCVVYNHNTALNGILFGHPDVLNVASVAYSKAEDNFEQVKEFCLEYARKITDEGNSDAYTPTMEENSSGGTIYVTLSKDENLGWDFFNNWTWDNFELYVEDLALFIVNDSACWGLDSEPIKEASEGLDSPQYCQDRNDGWACIITENQKRWWGYCEEHICKRCLGYGQACSQDYQCPDNRRIIGNSTIINGWQCGNNGPGASLNNECFFDQRCWCRSTKCYDECVQNAAGLDEKALKQFCTK